MHKAIEVLMQEHRLIEQALGFLEACADRIRDGAPAQREVGHARPGGAADRTTPHERGADGGRRPGRLLRALAIDEPAWV
jgi:hypothetical protein